MNFKRKVYSRLLEWKEKYSDKYAVLLEGARRVGKSTIAQSFGENEYDSCILIDFSKATANILECFDDIANLNIFFLRLQAETGITLYEHKSLIIFDEVLPSATRWKIQLSGNWFTNIHKEKCKGYFNSIGGNENTGVSNGLSGVL